MPTPRLEPGEWGKIRTYQRSNGKWMAVCQFCDHRGHVCQRSKTGRSEPAAIRALKNELSSKHVEETGPRVNGRTWLREFAEILFKEKRALVKSGEMSPGSLRTYQGHWRVHIEPALGDLAVEWVDVQRCSHFLKSLRRAHNYAVVKGVRSVLRQILTVAVESGAIPRPDPVSSCSRIPGEGRRRVKALGAGEAVHIWHLLSERAATPAASANGRTYRWTMCDPILPDLWLWMLGTGDRISQALAVGWRQIDLDTGTARLGPNVIRVPGVGLRINEGTSKSQEVEGIDLPEQVLTMLLARRQLHDYNPLGYVFPNADGGLLDPSNVSSKKLRPALKAIGYGHVSSHWCRRTLGSELSAAGLSLMDIAGRLRHADSRTTERHYVAKRGGNTRVRLATEAFLSEVPQRRVAALECQGA